MHHLIKDKEKYNIFTDECEMRRMAIMSSSNKKKRHSSSQKKKRFSGAYLDRASVVGKNKLNYDLSPLSSNSGLFMNGLGEQYTEAECRQFEKRVKIQKTNYSSLQNNKKKESKRRGSNQMIRIDHLVSQSPHSQQRQDLSSDEEEEKDIIRATSSQNRSICGSRKVNSKDQEIFSLTNPQYSNN